MPSNKKRLLRGRARRAMKRRRSRAVCRHREGNRGMVLPVISVIYNSLINHLAFLNPN